MGEGWVYLGDGVYVRKDEFGGIVLHANSHDEPTDVIYLEASVQVLLLQMMKGGE